MSKIWDNNNSLFFYGNEEKLNDLLSRAYGSVVIGYQKGRKKGINLSAKISAIFLNPFASSSFGLDGSGDFNYERAKTEI